jgi:thiopurine S-methyltransferase
LFIIMEPEFWRDRWRNGEIGFHRESVHPVLSRYWPDTAGGAQNVFVPLCGKTLDMRWLAAQGHGVTGVELERRAVEAFFHEWRVDAHERTRADGLPGMSGAGVDVAIGDFFAFRPEAPLDAFFDRAALVALPESMRPAYLRHLAGCVAPGARGLLITFEYDPDDMDGPPFPVSEAELRAQPWFAVECLGRGDAGAEYPHLVDRGARGLREAVYCMTRFDSPGGNG